MVRLERSWGRWREALLARVEAEHALAIQLRTAHKSSEIGWRWMVEAVTVVAGVEGPHDHRDQAHTPWGLAVVGTVSSQAQDQQGDSLACALDIVSCLAVGTPAWVPPSTLQALVR